MDENLAQQWLRGTIRGEMQKRGLTFADLTDRLMAIGVEENERNLRNKVARGTFSAVFFFQCLEAMGVRNLPIDLLNFLKANTPSRAQETTEERGLDGNRIYRTRLRWSADKPDPGADIIALPSEEYPDRPGNTMVVCGNCDAVLFAGWTIEAVKAQFAGEKVVGRCGTCRHYDDIPGSSATPSPG